MVINRRAHVLVAGLALVAACATTGPAPRGRVDGRCAATPEQRAAWLREYREAGARETDPGPDVFCGVVYDDAINLLPTHGNTLHDVLAARGITAEKVVRIEMSLGDTEGHATIVDPEAIDSFWWEYFRPAEPYKYWVPTRPHRVDIFVKGQREPAAVLRVNETDSTGVDGHAVTFMCHGLWDRVLEEVRRARQDSAAVPGPGDRVAMRVRVEEYLGDIGRETIVSPADGQSSELWHAAARVVVLSPEWRATYPELYIWGTVLPASVPLPTILQTPGATAAIQLSLERVTTSSPFLAGKPAVSAADVLLVAESIER